MDSVLSLQIFFLMTYEIQTDSDLSPGSLLVKTADIALQGFFSVTVHNCVPDCWVFLKLHDRSGIQTAGLAFPFISEAPHWSACWRMYHFACKLCYHDQNTAETRNQCFRKNSVNRHHWMRLGGNATANCLIQFADIKEKSVVPNGNTKK